MWKYEDTIFVVEPFPCRVMMTTVAQGTMKDAERRRVFCTSSDIDVHSITVGKQVHGPRVAVVDSSNKGLEIPDTDALVTAVAAIPLGVFTADCVPVFLAAKDGSCGGVVHAGWRGMAAGIIPETVKMLSERFAVRSADLVAAIGPHIQPCCYAVDADTLKLFAQSGPTLDLGAVALGQLHGAGITEIISCNRCTHHETNLFYSYRRTGTAERMMSVLIL